MLHVKSLSRLKRVKIFDLGLKLVSALQSFGWVVVGGVPIIIMLALVEIFAFWTNDFQFGLRLRLDKYLKHGWC